MLRIWRDGLPGLFIVGLAGFVWLSARGFPPLPEGYPGPGLFPQVIALLLGGAGVGLVLQSMRSRDVPRAPEFALDRHALRAVAIACSSVVFLLVVRALGIGAATAVACFAIGLILRVRWPTAGIAATLAGILVHLLFAGLLAVT